MILWQPEHLHESFPLFKVKDFVEQDGLRTRHHAILLGKELATGALPNGEEC